MSPSPHALEATLVEIERQHLTRTRRTVEGFTRLDRAADVIVEGRRLINFCGNDYLGLARHPRVADALRAGAAAWGAGSGASHLVTGHGLEHARLEEELAAFVHRERALLFSTGYMANLAAITSLAGRGDRVVLDRLGHASLIDAALLSGARLHRYAHGNPEAARRALAERGGDGASQRVRLIATDGVFSMDGDIAPVGELASVAAANDAWLIVDDAHGLGVLGATGRGTLEHLGVEHPSAAAVPVLVGTLGKAFGTFGAFIAGSEALIELLMQRARSYIYTTALPHALAAATRAALTVAQEESWRRERVLALTERFRNAARQLDLPLTDSRTPIQPIVVGSAEAALRASRALMQAGFWVAAIRPPTVPRGTARLRVTFSADHSEPQVDALVDVLSRSLRRPALAGQEPAGPGGRDPQDPQNPWEAAP
ncbi:MAG: 8-amino-7-oxononanoate synthase [Steroidobacteraceae bacterium]